MIVKLSDLRSTSWAMIRSVIDEGGHPDPSDIATALRRGDSQIPAAAQRYIAGLVDGSNKKRSGRPRKAARLGLEQQYEDFVLIDRVDRWRRALRGKGALKRMETAFRRVASERSVDWKTVRKYYREAKARRRDWK